MKKTFYKINSCLAEKVLTKDEILKGSFREVA